MEGNKPKTPLEVVESPSRALASGSEGPDTERRLVPRLSLSTEQFRLGLNGKLFGVADLSRTGMALRLLNEEDRLLFPIGAQLEGTLNVNRTKFKLSAQVRNIRGDHVGCQFIQMAAELEQELRQWLDPQMLGSTLRPMPSGAVTDSVWYNGRSGTEVIAWPDENGGLRKVLVILWGREFVEWTVSQGVRTGEVKFGRERDSVQGVLRWAPEWLITDASPESGKLNLAKTLLLSAKIPEEWKLRLGAGLVLPV